MNLIKKHLTNGQYFTQLYEKVSIFLHFTVSLTAMSAWRWWNQTPERVGTPYIIDRDGTIFECYDPKMWSFHLGIIGDDNFQERHSVPIEMVSAGPVHRVEVSKDKYEFRFYPLWPQQIRYTVIPDNEVITFKKQFRGFKYFHKFTTEQLIALRELCSMIFIEFPKITFDNVIDDMFTFDNEIYKNQKSGVYMHCSVRKDKSDIMPYQELLDTLKDIQADYKEIRGLIVKGKSSKDKNKED